MNCLKRLQRLFAGVIVVTFFATNTLAPAPVAYGQTVENFPKFFAENSFKIPAEFGKVTDSIKSSEGGSLLIHIQEAHANYDAQKNIQNILQYLSKNYGIQLVLLEGAGNKLTPEPFRFFPKNAQLQHSVNEKLMQAGELTGAEVFMIDQLPYGVRGTKDAVQAEAYGIENAAAYAKDRESYRKVYEGRGASDLFLKGVYLEWQKEASLRLNPELRELITRYAAFDEGTVSLESWLETLKKSSNTILRNDLTDVKAQLAWPTLVRYFRLRSLDGKIDLSKVEAEKATFLRDIAKYGAQSTEYGEKKLGDEMNAMFEMAKKGGLPLYKTRFVFERLMDALPADFSFDAYPNLRLRIQQMILISELQSEALQSEIKKLTASLVEVLVKTDEEKTLARSLREYQLLKKLFHLELSRGEYQQVLSRQISPSELMQELDQVRGKESAVRDTLPALRQLNEQAMNFYSGAIEREDFMMKRAREVMEERKQTKAVIITGGFHTEGFKQAITASGSSYIGIMPSIGEITADSNKNYLTALLGSNAITRSHIAPEKVTQQVAFFSAVSPRFWRRELAVRFARIRDIVRETVASYHDRSAENRAEFDAGFKKIIASAVGVSPRESQPQPSGLFRPELRAARVDAFFKTLGQEIDATYGGVKILPADEQYLGVISFDGTLPGDPNFWGFVLHLDHSLEYRVVGSEGRVSFRAGLEKTELSVQGAQDATPRVLQAYQGEFPIVAILRKREDNSIRIVEKSVRFATGSFDELGLGKFIRLTPFLQDQKSNETEQAYKVLARMVPESPSLAIRPVGHAAPSAGSPRAEVRSNPILPVMSSKDGKVEIHGDRADFSSILEFPDSAARDAFLNAGNFRVYLRWGNSKQKESWTFSEASMQSYGLPANQVKLLGSAFTTPYYNWKDYEGIFLLVPAATDDPSRALMESKDRLPEGVYRWFGPNIQTNPFLAPRAEARDKAVEQIREVIEAIRGQQSQINAENFRMVRKMLNKILEDVYKGGRNDLVLSAVGAVAAPITQALETFQKTKEPQTLLFQGALDKLLQNFFSKAEDEDIGPMVHTLTHRIGVAAFVAGVGPVGPGELPDEIMLASNFNEADFLKGLEGVGKSVLPDFLRNHKAVVHLSERAAEFQAADALAVEIPAGDGSLPGNPKANWQLFIDTLIRQFRAHEGLMDIDAQRGDQALHIDPAGLKRSQSFSMESWSRDQILGSVVTILFFPRSEVRNMGEVPLNLEGIKGKMNVRVTRGGKVGTVKGYGGGKEPFLEILFDGESDIQPFYLRGSASVGKPLLFASEAEELGSRKAAEAEAQKAASELAKTWTKTTGLAKGAIALIKKESLVNQSADRMYVHSRWMKKIAIASSSAIPPKNLGEEEEDRKMTDAEYAQDLQGLVEAFWGAYNGRAKERYLFSNATGVERFVLWKILGHELAGDVFFSAFNLRERLKDEKGKTAWQIRSKLKYGRISDKTIEEIWGEARPGNSKAPVAVARWNEGGFDVQSAVLRAIPVVERILQAEVQKGLEIGITLKPRPMDEIPSMTLSQKSPGKAVRSEGRGGMIPKLAMAGVFALGFDAQSVLAQGTNIMMSIIRGPGTNQVTMNIAGPTNYNAYDVRTYMAGLAGASAVLTNVAGTNGKAVYAQSFNPGQTSQFFSAAGNFNFVLGMGTPGIVWQGISTWITSDKKWIADIKPGIGPVGIWSEYSPMIFGIPANRVLRFHFGPGTNVPNKFRFELHSLRGPIQAYGPIAGINPNGNQVVEVPIQPSTNTFFQLTIVWDGDYRNNTNASHVVFDGIYLAPPRNELRTQKAEDVSPQRNPTTRYEVRAGKQAPQITEARMGEMIAELKAIRAEIDTKYSLNPNDKHEVLGVLTQALTYFPADLLQVIGTVNSVIEILAPYRALTLGLMRRLDAIASELEGGNAGLSSLIKELAPGEFLIKEDISMPQAIREIGKFNSSKIRKIQVLGESGTQLTRGDILMVSFATSEPSAVGEIRAEMRGGEEVPLNLKGVKGMAGVRVERAGRIGTVESYGGGSEPYVEIRFDGALSAERFYMNASRMVGKPIRFAGAAEDAASIKRMEEIRAKAAQAVAVALAELNRTWPDTRKLAVQAIEKIRAEGLLKQTPDKMYVAPQWMQNIKMGSLPQPPKELKYGQSLQALVNAFWGDYNGRWGDPQSPKRYLLSSATGFERVVLWKLLGREFAGDVFYSAMNMRDRLKIDKAKAVALIQSKLNTTGQISEAVIAAILNETDPHYKEGQKRAPAPILDWFYDGLGRDKIQDGILRAIPVVERILQTEFKENIQVPLSIQPRPLDEIPTVTLPQGSTAKSIRSEIRDEGQPTAENRTLVESIKDPFDFSKIEHLVTLSSGKTAEIFPGITIRLAETKLRQSESQGSQAQFEVSSTLYDPSRGASMPSVDLKWRDVGFEFKSKIPSGTTGEDFEFTLRLTGVDSLGQAHFTSSRVRKPAFSGGFRSEKRANRSYSHLQFEKEAILAFSGAGFAVLGLPVWNATGPSFTLMAVSPRSFQKAALSVAAELAGNFNPFFSGQQLHISILPAAFRSAPSTSRKVRSEVRNDDAMTMPVHDVVHIAMESADFFGKGGVKDVVREKPPALLKHLGAHQFVIMPGHPSVFTQKTFKVENAGFTIKIPIEGREETFEVYTAVAHSVRYYFIKKDGYFQKGYWSSGSLDGLREYAVFSRAAVEILRKKFAVKKPDIIHLHDAHPGLVAAFIRAAFPSEFQTSGITMTIHNADAAYQQRYGPDLFNYGKQLLMSMGMPEWAFGWKYLEFHGGLNLMKAGLVFSEKFMTVSPKYREELLADPDTGLQGVFLERKDDFTGILNGVDSGVWNPSKDNKIYQKYTSENVAEGKRANKLEFQKEVGLEQNPNAMLFVAATRLADQKGPELILEEARRLLNRHPNAQIAVIGEENHYAEGFRALMAQFPGRAYFTPAFSETLVRKAHAAEDFFLMPSKFEPCGLGQMQALRYGGIPIVHAVGGLDNTVLDPKEDAAMATGFKFYFPGLNKIKDLEKTPSFEAVMKLFDEATERAVAVYMNDPQAFYDMRARGMNSVRDWDELVPEFKKLYETARFNAFHLNGIPLAALRSEARAADPAAIAAVFMPHYLPTISELAAFISNMPRSISRGVQAAEESGQLLLYALGSAGYVSENVLPVIEGGAVGNGLEIAQAMVRVAQKANSKRAELRSWAEKNAPELEDYTVVTGQLEAGLDREILKKLEEKYGKTIAGLVAATTVTGGLGALMHDLFPSWQKNFGQPKKANIDAFAVNVIYDRIKGQEFAKDLPEEVTSGKKTLGDYLREVLTEDPGLSFSIFLDAGNEYRAKAEEWIGRAGDPLYKKRLQQAREAVDREIKVKVYPTNTFSGGMPNFYIEAFYIADDGTKVQIFDEVYPDTRDGGPNLWRDLHLAVYGKTKELLTLKLQEKGIAKKKILFVDNEVFASIPTPLFPDAPHHHMNHSVYSPTIYRPAEASFQLLGYPQAMRSRIIRNGTISIVDAVGISYDLVTGVALYEHTPAVSGGVMPGYVDVIDSFNQGGLRSTNGVLLEQWQAPFLRQLINTYKAKLGMSSESDDRDFFIKIGHPGNEAFLGEFKERTDMIKSYLAGRLMLWLKASQNKPEWFDQAMKSYQEEFGITEVDGPQVVADLQARIQKALEDESEWQQIFKDPKAQALRKQFLLTAIVSNVRRQVSYKGPDKWLEILRSLAADPAKLEQYKKTAARAIIGGREFGDEAHGLFLEIQRLIRELKLEDKFATIENYNIKDAPIIFQGVSGTVMITYMILEASATSMMKGLPNGAILMGAWGGAQPELFTIVDNETGLEKDIFRDKITYEQVVENLKSKKWKITNGFLVFYSKDGDGKFILSTLDDNGNIKVVNAPYPLAESMIEDLIALQKAYAVSGDRMNLQWEALRSSPLVDMEKSQARAHIKLWQRVIQKSEKQKALLAKPGLSAESALRFLSKKSGNDGGFVWRSEPSNALEIAPPGVLTFVESARQVRTHGVESYKSIAYHAARGEIFAKILYYFEGFEKEAPDFYQEMMRLKAEADKTNDLLEKVRIHLAALRLFDRFVVQLSETVLQGYIQSRSKEYERLFRDELFRQNLYFLLESKGKRFGSLNKKLVGFGVQVGDKKYIIGLNLGEQKYPAIDGGESKAWGQFYGNKAFQWLTDMLDPESAMTYHIVNTITGEVYGAGEERKPYPLSVLMEGALPIGVPDFQILELQAAGVMKPEKKREQRGSLILDDLRSLVSGNSGEQLRQQKPRSYWLKRMIQGTKPEDLKMLLQTVSGIGRDKANAIFGVEGVRPVMAFIATLVPELLEDMKEWDPEVYAALKNIMQNPETKDLFERGEVFFLDSSRDTAVVLARVLKEEKDGFEHKRHVVVPIHFSKVPYNKEEGKVWFGVGSISLLGLESSLVYQTRDHMLQIDYEKKHTLSSIQKEGWRVGISVVKRKDPAGIAQLGWRFQVLQMVPVGVNSSEGATQGMRSEARTGTSDAGTLNAAWPQHEAQKIAVIGGAGFVGATEASMLSARFGHDVTAVDIKPASVASLNGGKLVNYAPGLEEFLQAGLAAKRLRFTTNLAEAIEGREIIYLALPTPYLSNGESDTHFLEDAVADIARLMKPGEKKIIIGKSTAPPETIDRLKARIHQVGLPQGAEIEFAWIPEFLREGLEVEDALGGSGRMAVGAEKPAIADRVAALYDPKNINPQYPGKPIPIFKMGIKSAMLVKYAANGYRAWKISFINHLSWYAALFGFNVKKVAEKLGADPRIRPMFLSAGIGWGGSCFPKDSLSFMRQLAKAGMPFGLMMDTFAVNEAQWQMFANGIKQKLDGVKDKTVVVLGAAFKPNTSDDREARSILIIRQLVEWGAQVRVYDPVAIPSLQKTLADLNPAPGTGTAAPVQYFQNPEDLYSMMEGASAIVLVTEWDAFRQLNFKKVQTMFPDREKRPLVFDGRNAWDPAEVAGFGFQYFGISHETLPSPFVGETGTSLTRGMDEFVKKAIEFFLAGRIAFMISLAELAERSGGDIRDILKGLGADPVVGDLYLKPGIGFGGFDLFAALEKFTKFAESHSEGLMDKLREYREQIEILKRHYGFSGSNGTDTRVPFVTAFAESNERAVKLYVDKTREAVGGNLSGKTVTLLGLAYKPGPNSSIENAPSLKLIEALLAQGAKVRVTDAHPATASSVRNHFSKRAMDLKGVEFFDHKTNAAENAREAIRGSDAQILVTEWPEYADWRTLFFEGGMTEASGKSVTEHFNVVDGRHFYDPYELEANGFHYFAVGIPSQKEKKTVVLPGAAKAELAGAIEFPEKGVRIEPQASGRFQLKLLVRMKHEALQRARFFVHFGPRGKGTSVPPWHDQEIPGEGIIKPSQQAGEKGVYELVAEIDPREKYPQFTGAFGATVFLLPSDVTLQDAAFHTERIWAQQAGGVRDGEFSISEVRSEMRDTKEIQTILGAKKISANAKKVVGLLKESPSNAFWTEAQAQMDSLLQSDQPAVELPRIAENFKGGKIVTARGASACVFFGKDQEAAVQKMTQIQAEIQGALGPRVLTVPQDELHLTLQGLKHGVTAAEVDNGFLRKTTEALRQAFRSSSVPEVHGKLIGPYWHRDLGVVMIWKADGKEDPLSVVKGTIAKHLGLGNPPRPFHVTLVYPVQGRMTAGEFSDFYGAVGKVPVQQIPITISGFEINSYQDIAFTAVRRIPKATIPLQRSEARGVSIEELLRGERPEGMINVHPAQGFRNQLVSHRAFFEGTVTPLQVRNWNAKNATVAASMTSYDGKWFLGITHEGRTEDGVAAISLDLKKYFGADFSSNFYILRDRGTRFWKGALEWPHENDLTFIRTPDEMKPLNVILRPGQFHFFEILPVPSSDEMIYAKIAGIKRFVKADGFEYSKLGALQPLVPHQTGNFYRFQNGQLLTQPIDMGQVGQKVEGDSDLSFYVGPQIGKYLRALAAGEVAGGFAGEIQIYNVQGGAVKIKVNHGNYREVIELNERGVIVIKDLAPGVTLDLLDLSGAEFMIHMRKAPPWFKDFGSEDFRALPHPGPDRSAVVSNEKLQELGVLVIALSDKQNFMYASSRMPTQWANSAYTHFRKADGKDQFLWNGASLIREDAPQERSFPGRDLSRYDEKLYGDRERVHSHRSSLEHEGKRAQAIELYYVADGAMGFYIKTQDSKEYVMKVQAGDTIVIDPEVIHAIAYVKLPYAHVAVQSPSVWHLGMAGHEFKQFYGPVQDLLESRPGVRDEILHFMNAPQAGILELNKRSELRSAEETKPSSPVAELRDFFEDNFRRGGGREQGIRGVTKKLADDIVSLLAYTNKAKDIILSNLIPAAYAGEPVTLTREPKNFFSQLKIKMLYRALGVKTIQASDALVLDPETAFKRGLIYVIRNVFGAIPVVVLSEKGSTDRVFLEKINQQLRQANRPTILSAANLDEARELLATDREAAPIRDSWNLKAMVFAGAHNPQTALLAEELKENIVTIDQKMFRNFLNLAGLGVSKFVEQMQAEYFATAKSA